MPLGSGLLEPPGSNAEVFALAVFDDGSGPSLVAGGHFTDAGGVPVYGIAKWRGTTWSALGNGLSDSVDVLRVLDDGSGPALYAGGRFTRAGAVAASNIARWNGSTWSALGNGPGFRVVALAVFDDGSGPALFAAGPAFYIGVPTPFGGLAKWNGTSWITLWTAIDFGPSALAVFDDGAGPALYVGGTFSSAGGVTAASIARWNGSTWSALGSGVVGSVDSLAVFDDGSGPALYAGGTFDSAGGATASRIAKWDGSTWSTLGTGTNDDVYVLTVFDDGTGAALYAAGFFTSAGGVEANGIARWDGSTWSSLGSGILIRYREAVRALEAFDDGGGPALYASGSFTFTKTGVPISGIAKWDGASWSSLASSVAWVPAFGWPLFPEIVALATFDDGSGPALVAGGSFFTSPAGDSYLAKWGCTLPTGARTYGAATSGCLGPPTIAPASSPRIGNAGFAITGTNASPNAPGVLFAGTALMGPIPILGFQLWVNPIVALNLASDASGKATIPVPIPASPALVGASFDAQFLWLGPNVAPPCPPFGLSASNALELTIQP